MRSMGLQQYLKDNRISPAEFARRLSISRSHLHEVLKGRKGASLELALRIQEETDGEVTPSDVSALRSGDGAASAAEASA